MLLGTIKIAFLATVAALVVDVGALDGFACYAIGAALVLGAVVLFNAGCRVAARQEKQRTLTNLAGSIGPRLARANNPQSEQSAPDRQTT